MRIGIDLGGTKIEGIALDDNGRALLRRRVPTPQGDYRATVDAVADLVAAIEKETTDRGTVGVGIPGALSRITGLVKNANSTCLIGKPLQGDLEAALLMLCGSWGRFTCPHSLSRPARQPLELRQGERAGPRAIVNITHIMRILR